MKEPEIYPRFKDLMPPLIGAELEHLEASVLAEGIREPIRTWQNKIVDGHHRKQELQKGEASKLIEKFIKRQEKGLATFKQLRYLKALGHRDNFIENLTFDEASRLIQERAQKRNYATA